MASQQEALAAGRASSLARHERPGVATSAPAAGKLDGRIGLKGGARIKLDRIIPDPDQPRKTFDEDALGRLAESMRVRGQLVPGLVRWSEPHGRYVIIDGERRFRAATLAGLTEFACVVEDESDPDTILEYQLVTNALREDVPPVEKARAYERLMIAKGYSLRQLGDSLGIDHTGIAKSLDLLKLDGSLQAQVDAGDLAPSTAGLVARLPEVDQVAVARTIIDEGLSRSEAAEVVRTVAARRTPSAKAANKGRGAKPKPATARAWKRPGGLRIEATRARGLDLLDLAEGLRAALDEIEGEIAAG